jgi:hypothetical protein
MITMTPIACSGQPMKLVKLTFGSVVPGKDREAG